MTFEIIAPFARMISTLLNDKSIINRDFLYFGVDNLKVVCCRFIICGERVIIVKLTKQELLINLNYGEMLIALFPTLELKLLNLSHIQPISVRQH